MLLQCPKCHQVLQKEGKSYLCENHHTYDVAKGGYVNLILNNRKITGDDKGMVDARTNFLNHGYYQVLQRALCELLEEYQPSSLIDAGCGQGYYTNAFCDVLPACDIYGIDLSKFALKEACKAHNRVQYIAASVANIPLMDACAEGWVSVFAPIYANEVVRLLKPEGIFIKVGPAAKHLYELKEVLYDAVYENEETIESYDSLVFVKRIFVEDMIQIENREDIQALFQMTPYYYRSPKNRVERLCSMNTLKTRIQFAIDVYKKA